ncbi:hypothetical protein [Thalassospira xiamenensis]|uniref:hypothetical protein n=1 Tax=Thalassospira xiamenensis TaxID=220697 RepID=UPI001FFE9887|nr:hypothetical protein [Thalassospira xiamenensis]MCK2167268.1 hypothetical protein [Thalassospira xiamenensis]
MGNGQISCPVFAWFGGLTISRLGHLASTDLSPLAISSSRNSALLQPSPSPSQPMPGLPHSPRPHFRHVPMPEGHISPVMITNRFSQIPPETYRGYRASPPEHTSPVMIFPTAIDVPLATSPSPSRPVISLNNHCHFPVFPARNAKTRKAHDALRVFDPGAFVPLTLSLWHKQKNKSRTFFQKLEKTSDKNSLPRK